MRLVSLGLVAGLLAVAGLAAPRPRVVAARGSGPAKVDVSERRDLGPQEGGTPPAPPSAGASGQAGESQPAPPRHPSASAAETAARGQMPEAFQRQSERRIAEYLPRLRARVRTEDPALDAFVERICAQCVTGKLFDPMPPELPRRWFAPGGSYYLGQWLWDTMFVALAFAPLDDDAVLRDVFENYWHAIEANPEAPPGSVRYGMVPNFLGARELREHGRGWPPVGYSQIPILGWGVLGAYRQTNDRALVERALPMLVAFDEWYSRERDTDGDGLIEYGAYEPVGGNDLLQTARFETFDFHLPLDGMKLTPHPRRGGQALYGNVEGVEQTSFLLMTERAIAEIARELGRHDLARRYDAIVERRVAAIQRKMWDPQAGFFWSLDRDSDRPIRVRTIQGFLTLAAGAATPEQAATLARELRDPRRWWSVFPVPTAAIDEPAFDPRGYWRGDTWPPTTYLVAYGLRRYGFHDLALELTNRLRTLVESRGISEHYDSRSGEPLGVAGLGMSSTVWNAIVENVYGVQDDFRSVRVPLHAAGRRLKLGKLEIAYPSDDAVLIRSAFAREMRVSFAREPVAAPRVTCAGRQVAARFEDGALAYAAPAGETCRVERVR